jgi:hypothetical protein
LRFRAPLPAEAVSAGTSASQWLQVSLTPSVRVQLHTRLPTQGYKPCKHDVSPKSLLFFAYRSVRKLDSLASIANSFGTGSQRLAFLRNGFVWLMYIDRECSMLSWCTVSSPRCWLQQESRPGLLKTSSEVSGLLRQGGMRTPHRSQRLSNSLELACNESPGTMVRKAA